MLIFYKYSVHTSDKLIDMATTYVNLTMQQRLDVLKDLEMLPVPTVALKYHVCHMTIRRIRENATKIREFENKDKRQKNRQRIRDPQYLELDQRLHSWFIERKTLGDRVSDALLLKKATELKESMPSCSDFKVSYGWLSKFKNRHNIRLVRVYTEETVVDEDAAKTFVDNFRTFIKKNEINVESIYNMDESGLLWKALPTKTSNGENEKLAACKLRRERITISLCANATGTHKLMPLIISKFKKPRALKNAMENLPVSLKSQKSSWMDQELFVDWYINHFQPSVRQFQMEKGISGKTILLLDNSPGYKLSPNYPEDDNFEIKYLPPNTASLIQPMDQGIIEKTKRSFRHQMMRLALQYHDGIQSFYSNYSLNNCLDLLAEAWNMVTCSNIRNAWGKLISITMPAIKEEEQEQLEIEEMQGMMSVILEEDVDAHDIEQFLHNRHQTEKRRYVVKMQVEDKRLVDDDQLMDIDTNEKVQEDRNERVEQNRDDTENTDEDNNQNLNYQQKPEDYGIQLNAQERIRLNSIFKELEDFGSRMPLATELQIQALKLSILGSQQ